MAFLPGGTVTFSNPRGASGSYRAVDANTIEVDRAGLGLIPPEIWTVKVDDYSLTIKGRRHSYIHKNRFTPWPAEEPAPEAAPQSEASENAETTETQE